MWSRSAWSDWDCDPKIMIRPIVIWSRSNHNREDDNIFCFPNRQSERRSFGLQHEVLCALFCSPKQLPKVAHVTRRLLRIFLKDFSRPPPFHKHLKGYVCHCTTIEEKWRDDEEEEILGGYKYRLSGGLDLSDVVVLGWTCIQGPSVEDIRYTVPFCESV